MINAEVCFNNCINAPVRNVLARVELYNGSTLLNTFKYTDALKSFSIERVCEESKFFGFGVCQKVNVKLIDKERKLNITTANTLEIVFGTGCDYVYTNPLFYVTEVHRDENTNELSVTAYDALYRASQHTLAELSFPASYTVEAFVKLCASFLNLPVKIEGVATTETCFNTLYPTGANFDGTETIREALNAVAEVTQTVYFINHSWELVFKRLDVNGAAVYDINKDRYFTLDSGTNRRLTAIAHITELGDNTSASIAESGTTQYIRNNPLWELKEDIGSLISNALAAVAGFTINQFSCSWRGNYLLEIGDKVALTTKDNDIVYSYILNDVISYDGALKQETQWSYTNTDGETATNPTTLGDALKQTYARVDKANKQIDLLTSEINDTKSSISNLQINTDNIIASVTEELADVKNSVSAIMTEEQIKLEIQNELSNGVDKVVTNTGFTFDENGLAIEKTGSEMKTRITEDGMQVFRQNTAVLTANNNGVDAVNLHATTYLIIGTNSRFEDYGNDRTGCFWIGG